MATTKPRVNLTLDPAVYAEFKQLADVLNTQTGTLISTVLSQLVPTVSVLRAVTESATKMKRSAFDSFISQMVDIETVVTTTKDNALFDLAIIAENPATDKEDDVGGRTRRGEDFAAKHPPNPLSINKGVRSTVRRDKGQKSHKSTVWLASTTDGK